VKYLAVAFPPTGVENKVSEATHGRHGPRVIRISDATVNTSVPSQKDVKCIFIRDLIFYVITLSQGCTSI
jgi:hypothetical protein